MILLIVVEDVRKVPLVKELAAFGTLRQMRCRFVIGTWVLGCSGSGSSAGALIHVYVNARYVLLFLKFGESEESDRRIRRALAILGRPKSLNRECARNPSISLPKRGWPRFWISCAVVGGCFSDVLRAQSNISF